MTDKNVNDPIEGILKKLLTRSDIEFSKIYKKDLNETPGEKLQRTHADLLETLKKVFEDTVKDIRKLIEIILKFFLGLSLFCVVTLFVFLIWILITENPIEEKYTELFFEYLTYLTIGLLSSITIIISSCFIGAKGLLGFVAEKASRISGGG